MSLIAISGGIGSGKSVVSRILRVLGYPVFDCDSEAKRLMDGDIEIKRRLVEEIAADVVSEGIIDRRRLAEIVFSDATKLEILNSIVHEAVRSEIIRWYRSMAVNVAFVETAILYQSGLNEMVDAEWRVVAPDQLRISRVMSRNGITESEVKARIASQVFVPSADAYQPPVVEIMNDGVSPLLPRLQKLCQTF